MTRFLAIYHGAASAGAGGLSEESEFLGTWASWTQTRAESLVDPGAPLHTKKA